MAKRTPNRLLTDAFREIKNTRSRFISLLVLSALAVCFLAGLRATAPDMKRSADIYFDDQGLMDIRVVSTLGITEDDVAVLSKQSGILAAEGAWTIDAIIHQTSNDYIIKALSLSDTINIPRLQEGRLPQTAKECLVEPVLLKETGLSIGDSITLDTGTGDFEEALSQHTFTIVGTANSPLYVSIERGSSSLGTGKVSAFVLLPSEVFELDYFTDAYVLGEGWSDLMCYSDKYTDLSDDFIDALEPLGEERAAIRGAEVLDEAYEALADAEIELADAEIEVAQELGDAEIELADGRAELDDGWIEYYDGLAEFKTEIADAKIELADGQVELDDALIELTDAQTELDDARIELADGWVEYEDGYAEYLDGLYDFHDGVRQYEEGVVAYEDGLAEYEDGLDTYNSGKRKLEKGRVTLEESEVTFNQGKAAFDALVSPISSALGVTDDQLFAAIDDGNDEMIYAVDQVIGGILAQLEDGIAQAEAGILYLNGQLADANEAIENLPGVIAQLEEAIAAAEEGEDTSALEDKLAEYEGQLAAAETAKPILVEELDSAQETLDGLESSLAQIPADADQLLAAHVAMEAGRKQLDAGWAEYRSGASKLRSGKAQLNDAKKLLAEAKIELDDAAIEIEDGKIEIAEGYQELLEGKQELEDGQIELEDGAVELADGWVEYYDGVAELEDGWVTLREEEADAQAELDDGYRELIDGEAEYADGLLEYEDGKLEAEEKIADAKKELSQARRDIEAIQDCEWFILGRKTNSGYLSYSMDADRMSNLATVFPMIFFLVAALVSLTTMTRMVEEQRTTIGGMKALGYSRNAIAIKYVGYGFLASFIGSIIGLALGLSIIPWIICNAWGIIYAMGDIHYGLEPFTAVISTLGAVGAVTISALWACFSTLDAVPAELMRPKAPPMGKRILLERIGPLWRHLSFNYKVTLRNLFRYQRRFWMTVIGIGGCAALIVTAFGLRDSIFDIMDRQFDIVYRYTSQVGLVDKVTQEELDEVSSLLDESDIVEHWQLASTEMVTAETSTYTMDCYLQSFPSQQVLEEFINLQHRTDNVPVVLPDDGVVINEKLAEMLDVKPGDTILIDADRRVEARVADTTEHYIQHYIYMTDAYYQTLFGEEPQMNVALISYPDTDEAEELETNLVALDGVTSLSPLTDARKVFGSSLEVVDYAVVLITVCAAILAFVVLYNLTNINITERMRELATLKVLGFYDGELSAYIYRENVILTIFGVGMGMIMGKLLHQWLILTVEIDLVMFGRSLQASSYGYAVILTVIFSLLVNLSAHKKLKKLNMVESLKTVE